MKEDKVAVNHYINEQSESVRDFLSQLRNLILSELPSTIEGLSWSMPSYWDKHY
ncbi:hypothetical protein HMPREF9318_00707 [Streptococcus urinalis FB127-CNA-2]|uniref:YdhG-like domain-containing protein n=1 Tax=Streptococcus urinalis 2285-97 TaxID=764291 RepID=G5KHF2_9STRE|nr:hypothetical protein [Streptococcus urinalis]EHJ56007.1 hypothetical protein STRUR_1466 [Streptococcus urinalis 2285-97]EKS22509.1 hypothetical protein HMPREF9318_00707 [Streptococcus urinalis FB127-CNA-2]VEF32322.1 Uncharacterized conserved protein [Streptococcus urinalis]